MIRLPDFAASRRVLGPGPFRTYTIGNAISLIGTWMQRVTVGWLTWELTGSGTWLGLMAFADLFPSVIIGPFAGVAADRWNRHRLISRMQLLGLAQALALAGLHLAGMLDIGLLFAITLMLGIIQALAQPARQALISAMVPRELLASAVAINAISFNLARFLGPAAAGIVISTAGMAWAFAANALSYVALIVSLSLLPLSVRQGPVRGGGRFGADLREGLVHVLRDPGTRAVLAMMIVTGLGARPLVELLPGISAQVFGGGAAELALLTSAIGIGAILGGIWIANRPSGSGHAGLMVAGMMAGAAGVVAVMLTESIVLAAALLVVVGAGWIWAGICAQTLLQLGVEDRLRGRVLSMFGLIQRASPAVGALAVGSLSDHWSLRPVMGAAAALVVLYLLFALRRVPVIRDGLESRAGQQ